MGEVADQSEMTPMRAGRYLVSLPRRLALVLVVFLELGFWYSNRGSASNPGVGGWPILVTATVVLLVAMASWLIPITVVDEIGIHRRFARYRHIPWADVAGFFVVRTWRFARVEVQLPNGRNVTLAGVPESALRVAPDRPSSLDLFQARPLAPSHPSDSINDPWRGPDR